MLPTLTKSTAPASGGGGAPSTKDRLKQKALIIGIALAVMWGLEIIDAILGQPLNGLGIRPRTVDGLLGIILAPVLHGDFGHLLSNTVPFAILGFLTLLHGPRVFAMVTAIVMVGGGLAVWLIGGSNTSHIGASGVVFGYFGYLMAMGLFERSLKSIVMAVLVGLAYGSLIFGVLPSRSGVSWEGHLFGFLAGAGSAFLLSRDLRAARAKKKATPGR